MELTFLDQELSEAKLFRSSRNFGTFTGEDVSNMLYLNTLSVYLMSAIDATKAEAKEYAKRTTQYGNYAIFRTHATDIYMLAYQVKYPENDHANISDPVKSKKFLNSLQFADKRHIQFLRKLANGAVDQGEAHTVMQRLESQLKVTDSRYKTWRRQITNWETASDAKRKETLKRISQEISRLGKGTGRGSELLAPLNRNTRSTGVNNKRDNPRPEKTSTATKVAGAAAGAIAGRYAAGKMKKMSTGRAKNVGTGIGAIAGYWAAKGKDS